jgi:hypothetical protein
MKSLMEGKWILFRATYCPGYFSPSAAAPIIAATAAEQEHQYNDQDD